ncbi:MAG: radical SAM family heme chaperone HemW [Defluviitaleaceae bacterium]|nr:radical SAM family heme chaperone HemW [Defluviitaleaceae bacterium]
MVYVHIPFCKKKCGYCDFLSFEADSAEFMLLYKNALAEEIKQAKYFLADKIIESIFIGGGTPTAMPSSFLAEILREIKKYYVSVGAEINIEANPAAQNENIFFELARSGVNRVSIGLQAWQNNLLAEIGRIHSREQFVNTFLDARAAGIKNINVDLMYSLPCQSMRDWDETLKNVLILEPEHISAYGLTLESGTRLAAQIESGEKKQPDETTDRAMYRRAKEFLEANSLYQYEISNFAKSGFNCRHNTGYWKRKPYIGFGLGAHSFLANGSEYGMRWNNTTDIKKYIDANGSQKKIRENFTELTKADAMSETMFLSLRMNDGVSDAEFMYRFGGSYHDEYGDWIKKMLGDNLLAEQNDSLRLTRKGMDLANLVMAGFVRG